MEETPLDPDLTFAKTPAGEAAMQQRTRVVQRNLRMVLILVDGNATVAELCNRTGNLQLTQNALRELENDGFIERRTEKESVWVEGSKYARKPPSDSLQPPSEFSTYGDADRSIPNSSIRLSRPQSAYVAVAASSPPNREDQGTLTPPTSALNGTDAGTIYLPRSEDAKPEVAAFRSPPRESLFARIRTWLAEDYTAATPDLKPIKRSGWIKRLSWPLRALAGSALLLMVVILAALLFPYSAYLPELQAAMTQSTDEPSKVENVRFSLYPRPGLVLSGVVLGNEGDGSAVRISEVRLQPQLSTLFSSHVQFRNAELIGLEIAAESLTTLTRGLQSASRPSARAGVTRVVLDKTRISFAGLDVEGLKGELVPGSDERPVHSLALHSADRNLQVEVQPFAGGGGAGVQLEALGWRPTTESPYVIDSLTVKGQILRNVFAVDQLELRIFGGAVQGTAVLRAEKQAVSTGTLNFQRINVKRLGEALGIGEQFEGSASGRLNFSATSTSWNTILASATADGELILVRGSLGGIDLPEAVRRAATSPSILGGATRFEQITGTFKIHPGGQRFSRLILSAGLMQASGEIEITREQQIRGRMDVQMRGRTDHSAKSIGISGPLATPQVQALPTH